MFFFNYKEKSYFRAFFLTSIVTAFTATMAIEFSYVRKAVYHEKYSHSILFHLREMLFTFITAFCASFIAFYSIHNLTGFGNSMLHDKVSNLKKNL